MFDLTPQPVSRPAKALAADRRPRLLMRAARIGAGLYRRQRDLRPLLPAMATRSRRAADVAARLRPMEADQETARREGRPGYSPARHVAVLSALLAEQAAAKTGGVS